MMQPDALQLWDGLGNKPGTEADDSFYIGRRRAMVSLGPVGRRQCSFRCAFCYLNADFPRYASLNNDEIVQWLYERRSEYDIVYVSGDTDSFAAPRASRAVELLHRLLDLDVDVLFTTRALIDLDERRSLERAASLYQDRRRLLIGCVSISQCNYPMLEPAPIPSVDARLRMMGWMQESGVTTALTIRPLIPMISSDEYVELASLGSAVSSVIIGGDWYTDIEGRIMASTVKALRIGVPDPLPANSYGPLYFSTDKNGGWVTHSHPSAQAALHELSGQLGYRFFMGSEPAVAYLRTMAGRTDAPGQ